VCADVSKGVGSQQGIAYRVTEHIRIRMPEQSFLKWDLDAAEHELSPFGQSMDVVAYSYAT
jgi:hypothetical protein